MSAANSAGGRSHGNSGSSGSGAGNPATLKQRSAQQGAGPRRISNDGAGPMPERAVLAMMDRLHIGRSSADIAHIVTVTR